jgi:uncharacterized OsmC-like protein
MTQFSARVENAANQHQVTLRTGGSEHSITIAPKADGQGSSVNGGEALLLALATCCCNDIYREAGRLGIAVSRVMVEAEAEQDGAAGHPMANIVYRVTVEADAPPAEIEKLVRLTDSVAEIHNTLRQGAAVTLVDVMGHTSGSGH